MVTLEARGDADAVAALELVRQTGAGRTRLLLVLPVVAVADAVADPRHVDAGVGVLVLVGLAGEGVGRTGALVWQQTEGKGC